MGKKRRVDPLPEQFASYEEAAEFWDKHDTTDYQKTMTTADVTAELRVRRFEIEIDRDVFIALQREAQEKGVALGQLASDLLRQVLTRSA